MKFKTVGVDLPPSVVEILKAANAADHSKGGMPFAMASIIGALPWIAAAVHESAPEYYPAFVRSLKANLQSVWQIINHENPRAELERVIAEAKRSVQ